MLVHGKDKDGKAVDITTVQWNGAGTRLLTATTNGVVRIFSSKGVVVVGMMVRSSSRKSVSTHR